MKHQFHNFLILIILSVLTVITVGQSQELAHLKLACAPELRGSL